MNTNDVRDAARQTLFDRCLDAFTELMNVCADLDPTDVAIDLVEMHCFARTANLTADHDDDLMAFIASRDEMPTTFVVAGSTDLADLNTYAMNRRPDDECERGTIGCSVHHVADESCETW